MGGFNHQVALISEVGGRLVKFKKSTTPATHLPHHRPVGLAVHGDFIFATSEARTFGVHLPIYIPDGGGNRNRIQKFGANLEVFW